MENHHDDGPPNRQSRQTWPAQMDPECRNRICNEAMIEWELSRPGFRNNALPKIPEKKWPRTLCM